MQKKESRSEPKVGRLNLACCSNHCHVRGQRAMCAKLSASSNPHNLHGLLRWYRECVRQPSQKVRRVAARTRGVTSLLNLRMYATALSVRWPGRVIIGNVRSLFSIWIRKRLWVTSCIKEVATACHEHIREVADAEMGAEAEAEGAAEAEADASGSSCEAIRCCQSK